MRQRRSLASSSTRSSAPRASAARTGPNQRDSSFASDSSGGPDIGIRKSSAQTTKHYAKADLLNRHVVAVVNFPPKQIGPYISEVLTLGVPDGEGGVVLLVPERDVPIGGRMF